jgi:hypothetical protein
MTVQYSMSVHCSAHCSSTTTPLTHATMLLMREVSTLKYLEALEAVLLTVYPSISVLVKAFGVYGHSFRSYCDVISSQIPAHGDRQVALIPKTT